MPQFEYQVVQVKPDDLEAALNQMSASGWDVFEILPAESSGRKVFGRQTLDVSNYHVIFRREKQQP